MESRVPNPIPFLVSEFNKNSISSLIKECFGAKFPDISNKKQIIYLLNYLDRLGVKTVVCETNYTDRDFLIDHQAYYTRSFHEYPSKCARLHFFSMSFKHSDLKSWILENNEEEALKMGDSYLGFSVIKPLPITFLGRTALKAYANTCISKKYTTNLFGIELSVDSIAFQEQDKAVSACATTALWTLMHATSHFNQSEIDSPSTITLNAVTEGSSGINGFPNKGLSDFELLKALEAYGLKQHEFKIDQYDRQNYFSIKEGLKATKTFLDSKIPILAGTRVYTDQGCDRHSLLKGEHAICILGYKNDEQGNLIALYIHDDRIGPYVRADLMFNKDKQFISDSDSELKNIPSYFSVKVSGQNESNEIFIIDSIKIATYHKIRVPFGLVLHASKMIKDIINKAIDKKDDIESDLKKELMVDFNVKLYQANELKKQYISNKNIQNREEVLLNAFPKHVWVAKFCYEHSNPDENNDLFELVFDPTDSPAGNPLVGFTKLNPDVTSFIDILTDYSQVTTLIRDSEKISESYSFATIRSILDAKQSYFSLLDGLFGKLCAPLVVRDSEVGGKEKPIELFLPDDVDFNEAFDGSTYGEKPPIWVITKFGIILLGKDKGHPTLTDASPARIAGDIKRVANNVFEITAKSGRYSSNYSDKEQAVYLGNAVKKFKSVFPSGEFLVKLKT